MAKMTHEELEEKMLDLLEEITGDEAVREGDVLGVLTEFFRKDKHVFCTDKKYLRYAKRRVKLYPARRFFARVKGRLKNVVKACRGRGKKRNDGAEK